MITLTLTSGGLFAAAPAEAAAEGGAVAEIAGQFGVSVGTLIAQIINFGIVATALYFLAVKPVAKTLDERQQKIS
ncbi:MAG: ATP synthase F0 subunit B, partial [Bacteroidota bacterium]